MKTKRVATISFIAASSLAAVLLLIFILRVPPAPAKREGMPSSRGTDAGGVLSAGEQGGLRPGPTSPEEARDVPAADPSGTPPDGGDVRPSGTPAAGPGDAPVRNEAPPDAVGLEGIRRRFDGRDVLIAAADVNGDDRPDLIVFEKKEYTVRHLLLAKEEEGEFEEAPSGVEVPRYLERFLVLAADEGLADGAVSVMTETGEEREVVLLGP
ncbi:MAG: hypothetical protein JXP34_14465 [Planctomycetes bacterium]|nr:hypothetical protein [Planctomycetota bacterium]